MIKIFWSGSCHIYQCDYRIFIDLESFFNSLAIVVGISVSGGLPIKLLYLD
ncbi:hypothetical protein [Dolichospermum sp. LEGE 00246]|uniref:hypothetical protein n=1 Tax=Dolichospermum sp. LEGE 00246 TaxID=1828605 RepID=UPI00187ECA01|nr:hypothetical protein [Dolichospermum sp. LEGE 00246]